MSQSWRDLALHPPAAASPQPVAMAAFGTWDEHQKPFDLGLWVESRGLLGTAIHVR